MREAVLWEKKAKKVRCKACKHYCMIPEEKTGICHVRGVRNGKLYLLTYNRIASAHLDPVEKKPLYHFLPSTYTYSLGTYGCNFRCLFCQNWQLSQMIKKQSNFDFNKALEFIRKHSYEVDKDAIIKEAVEMDAKSISYTYNEPTIWVEFVRDIAEKAKDMGLKNIMVSSGYESSETIDYLDNVIDAYNIDLKAFNSSFYTNIVGSKIEGVIETIEKLVKRKIWVEITTLLIPGKNDNERELKNLARFIASISEDIPWHISRFHPDYMMLDLKVTPLKSLEKAIKIGEKEGLKYVYIGNVPGHKREHTYCPQCGEVVIERDGYNVRAYLESGKCHLCRYKIKGVWK